MVKGVSHDMYLTSVIVQNKNGFPIISCRVPTDADDIPIKDGYIATSHERHIGGSRETDDFKQEMKRFNKNPYVYDDEYKRESKNKILTIFINTISSIQKSEIYTNEKKIKNDEKIKDVDSNNIDFFLILTTFGDGDIPEITAVKYNIARVRNVLGNELVKKCFEYFITNADNTSSSHSDSEEEPEFFKAHDGLNTDFVPDATNDSNDSNDDDDDDTFDGYGTPDEDGNNLAFENEYPDKDPGPFIEENPRSFDTDKKGGPMVSKKGGKKKAKKRSSKKGPVYKNKNKKNDVVHHNNMNSCPAFS